jgi:hypothetical protein
MGEKKLPNPKDWIQEVQGLSQEQVIEKAFAGCTNELQRQVMMYLMN